MDAVVIVALAGIAPVEDEYAAVRPIAQVDAAEPGVGGEEDVRLVAPDVAAAVALEPLDIHAPAVEIQREELARDMRPATDRPGRYITPLCAWPPPRRAVAVAGGCRESVPSRWSQCQWSACWSIRA